LIATGMIGLNILKLSITGYVSYALNIFFNNDFELAISVQICIFLVQVVTYILCFIATIERNKFMLIPFLIVTIIQILFIIAFAIYITYITSLGLWLIANFTENNIFSRLGIIVFIFIFVIPIVATLAILLYFIIIVAKFYHEIDAGVETVVPPRIVIQQCTPSMNLPELQSVDVKGVATIYDPGGTPSAPIETF
jgi:hypothetical protein